MTVNPTAHGASHGSAGNDPIVFASITMGATGDILFSEKTDSAAPAVNKAVLYSRDNGSGKTQLVVRFNTGAVQVLATEP